MLNCYGQEAIISKLGLSNNEDRPETYRGLWCHWQTAGILAEFHGAVGDTKRPEELPDDYEPDSMAIWMVNWFVEKTLMQIPGWFSIELEEGFSSDFGDFILSGHVDVTACSYKEDAAGMHWIEEAHLIDFKAGRVTVPLAHENRQVEGYAVLFFMENPELKKLSVSILQPQNDESMGNPRVTTRHFTRSQLEAQMDILIGDIRRSLQNPLLLNTGWAHCRHCPGKLICPAYIKDMEMQLTQETFDAIESEPDLETLAKITLLSKQFSGGLDDATKLLKEKLDGAGTYEYGGAKFTVTSRAGKRQVDDVQAYCERMSDLPDDVYFRCILANPIKAEHELAAHLGLSKSSKKSHDAKDEMAQRFGDLISQPTYLVLKVEQ